MNDRDPGHTSLDAVDRDARVAHVFRLSLIAAAVLTVLVSLGLIAWWLLAREAPTPVVEDPIAAPAPLAVADAPGIPTLHFTDITRAAGIDFTHVTAPTATGFSRRPSVPASRSSITTTAATRTSCW
jgi:enediyne biosynthesis protein E4